MKDIAQIGLNISIRGGGKKVELFENQKKEGGDCSGIELSRLKTSGGFKFY